MTALLFLLAGFVGGVCAGLAFGYTYARRDMVDPAQLWDHAYWLGVHDEELSRDWTSGQVSPARANPYA